MSVQQRGYERDINAYFVVERWDYSCMNIQIFGTKKSFDSEKAECYFKERGIKYQFVDMKEKGLSKGEFNRIK